MPSDMEARGACARSAPREMRACVRRAHLPVEHAHAVVGYGRVLNGGEADARRPSAVALFHADRGTFLRVHAHVLRSMLALFALDLLVGPIHAVSMELQVTMATSIGWPRHRGRWDGQARGDFHGFRRWQIRGVPEQKQRSEGGARARGVLLGRCWRGLVEFGFRFEGFGFRLVRSDFGGVVWSRGGLGFLLDRFSGVNRDGCLLDG
eukprot:6638864-Pyramimonas_sp.AAC.1